MYSLNNAPIKLQAAVASLPLIKYTSLGIFSHLTYITLGMIESIMKQIANTQDNVGTTEKRYSNFLTRFGC